MVNHQILEIIHNPDNLAIKQVKKINFKDQIKETKVILRSQMMTRRKITIQMKFNYFF